MPPINCLPYTRRVGSYLGNALGCALGVFLLLNCGLMPQFTKAINAISLAKVSYPFKETFIKVRGRGACNSSQMYCVPGGCWHLRAAAAQGSVVARPRTKCHLALSYTPPCALTPPLCRPPLPPQAIMANWFVVLAVWQSLAAQVTFRSVCAGTAVCCLALCYTAWGCHLHGKQACVPATSASCAPRYCFRCFAMDHHSPLLHASSTPLPRRPWAASSLPACPASPPSWPSAWSTASPTW